MPAPIVGIIIGGALRQLAKVAAKQAAKRAAVRAAQQAVEKQLKSRIDDAIKKAAAQLKKEAQDRKKKCPSCKEPKNPCKSQKGGDPDGTSAHKGGSYGGTKGQSAKGYESNHMPSNDASSGAGGPSKSQGPAIQMDKGDHQRTQSWGSSDRADAYRRTQERHIANGKIEEAFAMDVADVMRIAAEGGNVDKYIDAIAEAAAYLWCLKKHGLA